MNLFNDVPRVFRVCDDAEPHQRIVDHASFYTPSRLSENITQTPEGYLLCHNVPIARVGEQLYSSHEFPTLKADKDGVIRVTRDEQEVFRPDALKSFEGKPVTIGHPAEFLKPNNWRHYAVGFTRDVRRGEGAQSGLVMADLLLTDEQAIMLVQDGLREVSCGYECNYTQDADEVGTATQSNIYGNHVALVARGRAGNACSIQDEENAMSVMQKIKQAFGVRTDDEARAMLTEDDEFKALFSPTKDSSAPKDPPAQPNAPAATLTEDRVAEIIADTLAKHEAKKAEDAAPKYYDKDGKQITKDEHDKIVEADKADKAKQTADATPFLPKAEILVPGIKVKDGENAEAFKRRVLDKALEGDNAGSVKAFTGDSQPDDLAPEMLDAAFNGSAEVVRQVNNSRGVRSGISTQDFGKPTTIADINQANQQFWNNGVNHAQ